MQNENNEMYIDSFNFEIEYEINIRLERQNFSLCFSRNWKCFIAASGVFIPPTDKLHYE